MGTSGGTDPEKSSAILFEMDNAIEAPELDPGDEESVSRSDPFINIDWSNEGGEYDGDTHKKVTLTVLTLDGEDVLDRAATSDNRSFILTTSGLDLGDHEIAVNGEDESGNTLDSNHEVTFTVKARPGTKIALKPGMNLISLPGTPADTSINSVVTLSQVSAISTYDAATGTWLSATRDDSGSLSGDLDGDRRAACLLGIHHLLRPDKGGHPKAGIRQRAAGHYAGGRLEPGSRGSRW